jgi:hypothetical protein
MSNKFLQLRSKVYSLLFEYCTEKYKQNNLLEEDLELCEIMSDKIISALTKGCSKKDLFNKLIAGITLYDRFSLKIDSERASNMLSKLIVLQSDIQKYNKLAIDEKNKFSDMEIENINRIEKELDEYLRIGEKLPAEN